MDEVFLPPFTVDMLLTEVHIGVEYDGPSHVLSKKRDQERDAYILDIFGLPILRIKDETNLEDKIEAFIEPYLDDVKERRSKMELQLSKCSDLLA